MWFGLIDKMNLKDGTYQVTYKNICAGFVVKDGKIIKIAPILIKRINYWKTIAKRIEKLQVLNIN